MSLMNGAAKYNSGFTVVELILVISVIGILAVIAIPKYYDLRQRAYEAQRDGMVIAVRGGIDMYALQAAVNTGQLDYPPSLDNAPNGTCVERVNPAQECFGLVLKNGMAEGWQKYFGGLLYRHAKSNTWYWYRQTTGLFQCIANCWP